MHTTVRSLIALAAALNLICASTAPIGVAKAGGDFRLDNALVRSNTTVFEGSTLESGASRLDVTLKDGVRLTLSGSSRGRLYGDRMMLEKGATELAGAGKYRIEALTLAVTASESSAARVGLDRDRVVVTAKSGVVNVTNSAGVLVARVFPGKALELDPQAAETATATQISGLLKRENGKFLLEDTTTRVIFEIRGGDLARHVGKQIVVVGKTLPGVVPVAGATQVVHVSVVKRAAAAPVSAGKVAGMPKGTFAAVVGGVAAASTVGGLAAAGAFSGNDNSVSRQ